MTEILLEFVPFLVVEIAAMVFWRWIVIEGRWFGRPPPEELNPEAVTELQNDASETNAHVAHLEAEVGAVAARVAELEDLLDVEPES